MPDDTDTQYGANLQCTWGKRNIGGLVYKAGPSEVGELGGNQPPHYFATICSLHFRENIARPYYTLANILTS